MKRFTHLMVLLLTLTVFIYCDSGGGGGSGSAAPVVLDESYYTDLHGWNVDGGVHATKTTLGRGINMGNFLEADGGEGAWTGGRKILENDFTIIKNAGFKTVRIPVRFGDGDNAGTSDPYTITPAFLTRVETIVNWALAADLKVIINVHHYTEMMDESVSRLTSYHRPRLKSIWNQICAKFPVNTIYTTDKLIFELLNEPNGTVGYSQWNTIIAELTTVIWTDNSGTQTGRKIMIGTANWGGVPGLNNLSLPAVCNNTNTYITVHYYEPFHFTHQGAEWVSGSDAWIGTAWTGSSSDQTSFVNLLDQIVTWNAGAGRSFEIFLGEFGAYTKHIDPAHQKAWSAFLTREAEERNFSWAYWEFCSGFGAYNLDTNDWRPLLLEALIPTDVTP